MGVQLHGRGGQTIPDLSHRPHPACALPLARPHSDRAPSPHRGPPPQPGCVVVPPTPHRSTPACPLPPPHPHRDGAPPRRHPHAAPPSRAQCPPPPPCLPGALMLRQSRGPPPPRRPQASPWAPALQATAWRSEGRCPPRGCRAGRGLCATQAGVPRPEEAKERKKERKCVIGWQGEGNAKPDRK